MDNHIDRKLDRYIDSQIVIKIDNRQIDRYIQIDRYSYRQKNRQIDSLIDRKREKQIDILNCLYLPQMFSV